MTRIRRALWMVGAPPRWVAIGAIRAYRLSLGGWLGGQCRFSPSCSVYAEQAVRSRGLARGLAFSAWRILRCNPFGRAGSDPAPRAPVYDGIPRRGVS